MANQRLEAFIDQSIQISRKHDYNPRTFVAMRKRHQTVGAISRLVASGDLQSGFKRLQNLGLIDWTIEAAVARFPEEFSEEVRRAAQWRLEQARSG